MNFSGEFKTKKNNGSDGSGDYSNQCMWISILDFLNGVLSNHYNLTQIREIASNRRENNVRINNPKEEFRVEDHYDGLLNIVETFDLQIHFYVPFKNSTGKLVIPNRPDWIIGEPSARNVVSIVSYGTHFELITSINSIDIYGDEIEDSNIFKPDRELAVGKKISQSATVEHNELNEKIDNLLEFSVNLSRVIINIEQSIKSNKMQVEIYKSTFETNQNHTTTEDFDTQTAIVASFQEHRDNLQKIIDDLERDLVSFKSQQTSVRDELLIYFD